MRKRIFRILSLLSVSLAIILSSSIGFSRAPVQPSPGWEITWDQGTGTPSFVRGKISLAKYGIKGPLSTQAAAQAFISENASLWKIQSPAEDLAFTGVDVDSLGMSHITYQQVYQGVEVYGADFKVHLDAGGQTVVAASSGFIPGVHLDSVQPAISKSRALEIAFMALPGGELLGGPRLVIYPLSRISPAVSARLAWLVELRDLSLPARNLYLVDAKEERILDVVQRLTTGLDRRTYDAQHGTKLPGVPVLVEGRSPIGDSDSDQAHEFAGETYDYFYNTFGRDSYDNQGATIISSVHYGNYYQNAFWDGSQMVYGDGFPVKDVTAHELTHAIIDRTSMLGYSWQAGALNESFADIFGVMVDRDDWLVGEDLPSAALAGQRALRDFANPARFGQPAHVQEWVNTCEDEQGVHINSGIPNKAFYLIAMTIGKDRAEQIFFRSMTVYTGYQSKFKDARAAALQSAQDIFPGDQYVYDAILFGFDTVGITPEWDVLEPDCECSTSTALGVLPAGNVEISPLEIAATLYQVRDHLLDASRLGRHYQSLYAQYTGRISRLLLEDPALRHQGAALLQATTPGFKDMISGDDSVILTQGMLSNIQEYLRALAQKDRQTGDGELATVIESEMARIDWDRLVGMTFSEAWDYQKSRLEPKVYLPAIFVMP